MEKTAKIYVAGHTGLVGSAVVRRLKQDGYQNLILYTYSELDLMDSIAVQKFFKTEKPEYVVDCAAKVGGIQANIDYQAEFFYENIQIQNNLIWAAKEAKVRKFLFISSAVVYPNNSPQPMKEEYFMQGEPDPTKSGYAHAKIAGIKFCEYIYDEFGLKFISCMPTNLYGENDNFNPKTAHVIPAIMRRMHEAKVNNLPEVTIWGKGDARREFMYVDDLASALVWMLANYEQKQTINIGTGEDISMKELGEMVKKLVDYKGNLVFDATKPEGIPKRLFDVSRIHKAGWHHSISFEEGLKRTYDYYLSNIVT